MDEAQRDTLEDSLSAFLSSIPRDRTDLDGHVQVSYCALILILLAFIFLKPNLFSAF